MLSTVIMADERRRAWAFELSRELGAEIVWDTQRNVWDTRKRSLLAGFGTHVMILQDDAVPSEGLQEAVINALEFSGDHPIGLFSIGPRADGAKRLGVESWWSGEGPNWNVASVFPMSHVPDLVQYGDTHRLTHDDPRIRNFYLQAHIDCWYTMPSLVDHRGDESLISKGARVRRAARFGSGLEVDWSIPPTRMDKNKLYPIITMSKNGLTKRVRQGTRFHERAVRGGWE